MTKKQDDKLKTILIIGLVALFVLQVAGFCYLLHTMQQSDQSIVEMINNIQLKQL